jgi:hypothetical protein
VKEVKFFKEIKDLTMEKYDRICRCLKFQVLEKNETVFHYGSFGEEFFVIISGKVEVRIPNPKIENFDDHFKLYIELKEWYKKYVDGKYYKEIFFKRPTMSEEDILKSIRR